MAKYIFKCSDCDDEREFNMAISDFLNKKRNGFFKELSCDKCIGQSCFSQKFDNLSSKIKMDRETLVEKILDDSRKIAEKVRSGDQKAIRDIYGEDK